MTCVLVQATQFRAVISGDRLTVEVVPGLELGHRLAIEVISLAEGDVHLQLLDCDDGLGDGRFVATSLAGVQPWWLIHVHYAGGTTEVAIGATDKPRPSAAREADAAFEPPPSPGPRSRAGERASRAEPTTRAEPPEPEAHMPSAKEERQPEAMAEPPSAEPRPAIADSAAPREEPDTIGYGRFDSPDVVVVGSPFTITVGLSPSPTAASGPVAIPRPPGIGSEFILSVQLHADPDAFAILEGGSWNFDIPVTAAVPHPWRDVRFVALSSRSGERGSIQAIFSIGGHAVAWLPRQVAIVDDISQPPPPVETPTVAVVGIPMSEHPPDLTLTILSDPTLPAGNLEWGIITPPGSGIAAPAREQMRTSLGEEARAFAMKFIAQVPSLSRTKVFEGVCGFGRQIAAQVPMPVIAAMRHVIATAESNGRTATVMLLSREPYVPWELALLDMPIQAERSPFLGGQAAVGRWVLGPQVDEQGNRRPPLPPPTAVTVKSMAVVSGKYLRQGWADLPHARREARDLQSLYGAKAVEATESAVLALLRGRPSAQLMHFAIHGRFNPTGTEEGMILVDGQLEPTTVLGAPMHGRPFVFLNACQLGSSEEMLGDYAGMADSLLQAGAAGVIAPLWNVRDTIARDIAMEFYRAAFEKVSAGEVIRRVRARFTSRAQNATYLAYQLYGDPLLTLSRTV
jgi:hypothetical protein